MTDVYSETDLEALFPGNTETAVLCRAVDWSATSLGPTAAWSPALRFAVRTAMECPFPINLWCGEDRILIYNDGYRAVLGSKHPRALARPGRDVWAEIACTPRIDTSSWSARTALPVTPGSPSR